MHLTLLYFDNFCGYYGGIIRLWSFPFYCVFRFSRGDRGGKIVKGMEGIIAWERMAVESF